MTQESSCVSGALILFGDLAAVDRSVWDRSGGIPLSEPPACRHSEFCNLVGEDGMRQAALLRSDKGLGTPGTDRKKAGRQFRWSSTTQDLSSSATAPCRRASDCDLTTPNSQHRRIDEALRARRRRGRRCCTSICIISSRTGFPRRGAGRKSHIRSTLAGRTTPRSTCSCAAMPSRSVHPGVARGLRRSASWSANNLRGQGRAQSEPRIRCPGLSRA